MDIKELNVKLADAPALLTFRGTPIEAGKKGTILFYHGLKARKEGNRKEYKSLAQKGFLVAGIDNVGHGERLYKNFDDRAKTKEAFEIFFTGMVRETAEEVPIIIEELVKNYKINRDKVGICGISMGGYITYSAILIEPSLKAATPILGSPKWKSSLEKSPHNHPEKFFPVALLSQNAGKDESVSPVFAKDFHRKLEPFYKEKPEKLKYIEFPDSGHFMIEEDWNELWDNTVNWFCKFLK